MNQKSTKLSQVALVSFSSDGFSTDCNYNATYMFYFYTFFFFIDVLLVVDHLLLQILRTGLKQLGALFFPSRFLTLVIFFTSYLGSTKLG